MKSGSIVFFILFIFKIFTGVAQETEYELKHAPDLYC